MKKFLLLLVGVLFALSAKADWTFYVDISGAYWTEAPYFYAGHDETFHEAKQCSTTSVEGIYKVTFNGWNDLAELYICKSKLVNTTCTKAQIEAAGTANVDWFGKFSTTAYSQPEYGFDSNNSNTPLFKLTKGSNGASITINYDPNATDPDPTPSGDVPSLSGNYCFFLNTSSWGTPKVYVWNGGNDNTWSGDEMTKFSGDLYYWQLDAKKHNWDPKNIIISDNGGSGSKRFEKPYTNGAVYKPDGSTLAAEKTTYYFDVAGSEITSTPSLSIGWATVEGTLTENCVYSFTVETAIPTEYWVIKFTDGTNNYTSTALTADHVYKYESTKVADKGLYSAYTPATPSVETAYTIYFDAVRSGSAWANPHLTIGGVEVIGVADGSLIKYVFNAVKGDAITFSNGSAEFAPTLANNTVYYVFNNGISYATKSGYSYSPTHEFTYRVHGQITTGSWTDIPMTYYPDGTWRTAAIQFVAGGFGIQKLKDGSQYKDKEGWIWCSSNNTADYTMSFGVKSAGSIEAENGSGNNWAIAADSDLDDKKEYVLVFDPANKTVMFINPAAATAKRTVAPVSTNSHANKLSVTITPSEYTSATGSFTLSNGAYTATSKTGTFENVPYASNYTLTAGGTSMPINITMPAEPTFDITATNATVFAPAAGQTNGILSVAFTVSTTWAYNLPHVICTCGGKVVPGNVEWSEGGFTFSAAEAVPLDGTNIADDMTFKFVITPEYPFMVNAASARGQMRVAGTGIQNVLGTAITDAKATLTRANDEVSGVEGLVIEAEDAPVEYFNLQGQRVDGDLAPGIYIRRQGATVTKVRI